MQVFNHNTKYLHTDRIHHFWFLPTKSWGAIFAGNTTVNCIIDRSETRRQCARIHYKRKNLRSCGKVLITSRIKTDAENQQNDLSTLVDFSTVTSLGPILCAPALYFAKFMQWYVREYRILNITPTGACS